jgi:hypothetical protein
MRLQYGGLQARLLGWKNHAWKDFSPAKINQIGAFVQLLRAAKLDLFYIAHCRTGQKQVLL